MCMQKHPWADLYIFGYYRSDPHYRYRLWDATNSICRGLITDGSGNIIQRPFSKFWTFKQYLAKDLVLLSEGQTKTIKSPVKAIHEKVDGTMGVLYWVEDVPYIATQRSFTNAKAVKGTQLLHEKYAHLFGGFNRELTYVFEILYSETAIVVTYDVADELVLIGLIETSSGRSLPLDSANPGFRTCQNHIASYGVLADELGKLESLDLPNAEGFVVHYEDDSRIKVKFPSFRKTHNSMSALLAQRKQLAITEHALFPAALSTSITAEEVMTWSDGDLQKALANSRLVHHMLGFEFWVGYWFQRRTMKLSVPGLDALVGDVFNTDQRVAEMYIHETLTWEWRKLR